MRVYVLAALVFEHLMPGKGVGGEGGRGFPLVSGHLSALQEGSLLYSVPSWLSIWFPASGAGLSLERRGGSEMGEEGEGEKRE